MKHLADICVNPQLLGGRQSLQESLETLPICHCISLLPYTIPEVYRPVSQPRGGNGSIQSDATGGQEMTCCDK